MTNRYAKDNVIKVSPVEQRYIIQCVETYVRSISINSVAGYFLQKALKKVKEGWNLNRESIAVRSIEEYKRLSKLKEGDKK